MSHTGQSLRRDPAPPEIRRLGTVEYSPTWELQRALAEERADGQRGDTILLLEHPATYTAGKRTEPSDRPTDGTPVVDVDRGGRITWHGPGQLVGYPIIARTDPIDVVEYVRKYGKRNFLLHMKDRKPNDADKIAQGIYECTEVGYGVVDFKSVIALAKEFGTQWYVVEQESFDMPMLESIAKSAKWLNENT